mmetsp:Transcript_5281/g.5749  ORF Transcript_5281/g.5749 Transcript_5281/m.5749 type:complete len:342 (-) Transcript_5281:68-1093(-)
MSSKRGSYSALNEVTSINGQGRVSTDRCTKILLIITTVVALYIAGVLTTNLVFSVLTWNYHTTGAEFNVICSYSCGQTCIGKGVPDCYKPCFDACVNPQSDKKSNSVLGGYIRRDAVHHVGVTVSNLTASVDFYTNILGGALVPEAGGDNWNGDDVLNLLFQENILQGRRKDPQATLEDLEVADLSTDGTDTLAARYISFGTLNIELLDYRAINKSANNSHVPYTYEHTSPSIVPAMHICFYLHDDVVMNDFILKLEDESKSRGYDKVKCNRIIEVKDEEERVKVGKEKIYNSFVVTDGNFQGWRLTYCKGPDGEQFEIAQATGRAKKLFSEALGTYLSSK